MNTCLTLSAEEHARREMDTPIQRKVEIVAQKMRLMPQVECPVTHEFAHKLYIRTIRVPAKTLVVSKIFKVGFPFFVAKGTVSIWTEHEGTVKVSAPYWGWTKFRGFRR